MRDRPMVLIIDADRDLAEAARIRLSQAGFHAVVSLRAPAGIRAAVDGKPDVVLVDIRCPYLDGFCVLRQLKELDATRAIPVVAFANAMVAREAQQLGVVGYVAKPYRVDDLVATIRRAVDIEADARVTDSGPRRDPPHAKTVTSHLSTRIRQRLEFQEDVGRPTFRS